MFAIGLDSQTVGPRPGAASLDPAPEEAIPFSPEVSRSSILDEEGGVGLGDAGPRVRGGMHKSMDRVIKVKDHSQDIRLVQRQFQGLGEDHLSEEVIRVARQVGAAH